MLKYLYPFLTKEMKAQFKTVSDLIETLELGYISIMHWLLARKSRQAACIGAAGEIGQKNVATVSFGNFNQADMANAANVQIPRVYCAFC